MINPHLAQHQPRLGAALALLHPSPDVLHPGSRSPTSKYYAAGRAGYELMVQKRAMHDMRAHSKIKSTRAHFKGGVNANPMLQSTQE